MDFEKYSKNSTQFYSEVIPSILLKFVKNIKWDSYIDLGCGDGSLLYALNNKGFFDGKNVYAVDLSQLRIDKVKKINEDFICYISDTCNLKDIKDGSIDFVTTTQVIEHVEDDEAMIKEIRRILNSNGIVYLSTVFKKRYAWYFYRCNGKWTLDPTHVREYTKDSQLLDIIQNNGFKIVYNNKSLIKMSIIDFILRKMGSKRNVFQNSFLAYLRKISIPIFGYYNWEVILESKSEPHM
ncbi:class I SAM-dependent methyltransferase [Methanobacterium sp.]|jgi:2-polyprenyl-3-methyl-5-hydroxy-6-metoxy-1,4-benzoquinol methylase|uniref:class I SAM-dependent methyltransferase n=1 Tax=Methanobacterium sp. TaxID=2164 RepID=UPI00315836E1